MSTFQDVLNDIALVIGGTKQASPPPGFYSGAKQGDGTGVSGLNGCYSMAPFDFEVPPPVAILLPGPFRNELYAQGYEDNLDHVRLLVLVAKVDMATDLALLTPFRDTIPAALRAHFQADQIAGATPLTPEPLYVFLRSGKPARLEYPSNLWWGWDFDIEVRRTPNVSYTP